MANALVQTYSGTIQNPAPPNLPVPSQNYSADFENKMLNVLRLYFNQLNNAVGGLITTTESLSTSLTNSTTSYIEVYDRSTSIALTTTPALLRPANTLNANGITYNATTGVFTFQNAGTYSLSISLNITTSNSGQIAYLYAQKNTGSGWVNNSNSGKLYDLVNNATVQYQSPQSVYRAAGEQTRYYIYSSGTTSSLVTSTMPGVSPTVYVPAIRIQFS